MDWKCESSGMSGKMKIDNMQTLCKNDVLKFVVGSIEDLHEAESVVAQLSATRMPHLFISPVFGTLSYQQIVDWMLDSKIMTENKARFQVQLHKVVWNPDMRGV